MSKESTTTEPAHYIDNRLKRLFRVKSGPDTRLKFHYRRQTNADNAIRFLDENCKMGPFLDYVMGETFESSRMFPLLNFMIDFHKNDYRKASGDPYTKHLFLTTQLCMTTPEFQSYSPLEKRIIIGAALLHDSIEIKRKTIPDYDHSAFFAEIRGIDMDINELRIITAMVNLLITPPKRSGLTSKEWLAIKMRDFLKIMNLKETDFEGEYQKLFPGEINSLELQAEKIVKMIKLIKIADDTAIVRETVDDYYQGYDYVDGSKGKINSFVDRYRAYRARLAILRKRNIDGGLVEKLENDPYYLQQFWDEHQMN